MPPPRNTITNEAEKTTPQRRPAAFRYFIYAVMILVLVNLALFFALLFGGLAGEKEDSSLPPTLPAATNDSLGKKQ